MSYNRSALRALAMVVLACLIGVSSISAAERGKAPTSNKEKKISKKQIPAAVLAAFQKAYPKAVIKGSDQETKDSTTYVEIESVDGTVKRDIQYTSDGKVVEIEESVDVKTLPELARQAVTKDYPKGKIEKAERVTQGDKIQYEVTVAVAKNRTEIVFDASGNTIKTEAKKKGEDQD